MGLFNAIERLNTADERPVSPKPQAQHLPIPPAIATAPPKAPARDHHQTTAEDSGPVTWRLSLAETDEPTEQQIVYFRAAWLWIKENKSALLAAGWNVAALVRRGRCRWPYGSWGVAWLPTWIIPDLAVSIGRMGEIVFIFPYSGRTIKQTARRPSRPTTKKRGVDHE